MMVERPEGSIAVVEKATTVPTGPDAGVIDKEVISGPVVSVVVAEVDVDVGVGVVVVGVVSL